LLLEKKRKKDICVWPINCLNKEGRNTGTRDAIVGYHLLRYAWGVELYLPGVEERTTNSVRAGNFTLCGEIVVKEFVAQVLSQEALPPKSFQVHGAGRQGRWGCRTIPVN
jgi:hypothetical protein